jgi:hypothetical protein
MKGILLISLSALLPLLSGCITSRTLDAGEAQVSETTTYDSADRIAQAGITADGRLCILFEQDWTNSPTPRRFSVVLPLSQVQSNSHYVRVAITPDGRGSLHNFRIVPPGYIDVAFWSLPVSAREVRTNWNWSENDWRSIPVGKADILRGTNRYALTNFAALRSERFAVLPNATQTVYLIHTEPIEFVYVDASSQRDLTTLTIHPPAFTHTYTRYYPGYYFLLPLTVPLDIVTLPLQGLYFLTAYMVFGRIK